MSSRAEKIRSVLIWEAVAAKARDTAAELRAELATDARAELADGIAPTWRLPELATVTLPVSQERPEFVNARALLEWVRVRRPDAIDQAVNPVWLKGFLGKLRCEDDGVVTSPDGEVIPGVRVRPGGTPGALSVRPTAMAKRVLADAAEDVLTAIAAAMGEPSGAGDTP